DRWIDFAKADFVGREAALKAREAGPSSRVLVTLEIEDGDADATGYEPLRKDGAMVGFITSGGYGYTLGKSLAMALVARAHAAPGSELETHIVGAPRRARVVAPSPYDPAGARLRL